MATAGSIVVDLLVRTGSFETDMNRAARASRRTGKEIEQSAKGIGAAWRQAASLIKVAFAGFHVASGLGAFIQNTITAQNEQAQLAAVLNSTGRAATTSVGELNKMATAMSKATTFSTGDINQAQTTLLAFTGIAGKEFPRAMQAAADMAARTGMTFKSAAELIGRALDVPSQGLTSLTRQGFRFTDEQKKLAEHLEATGRKAAAQAIVLGALEESYGGAATAARDTLGGALAALRNTISALLTDESGSLGALRSVVEGLNDALGSDAARTGLEALAVGAGAVAVVLGARLAAGALAAAGGLAATAGKAVLLNFANNLLAGSSVAASAGLTAMSAAARTASAALAFVGGPIGAVVLALGGAAWAWNRYGKSARESAPVGVRDLADAKLSVDDLVTAFENLRASQRQGFIDIKTEELKKALRENQQAVRDLGNAFKSARGTTLREAAKLRAGFMAEVQGIVSDTGLSAGQMDAALVGLIDAYVRSGRASESSRAAMHAMVGKVVEATGSVAGLHRELNALSRAQHEAASSVAPVVDELDRYREAYAKFLKEFATPDERLKQAVAEQRELLGPLFDDDALKRIHNRYAPKPPKDTELENLVKRLEEQRATLGMTTVAAERYRIEQAKGADAHRARALALFDEVQAWKDAEETTRKAAESARYFAAIEHEIDLYRQGRDLEVAGIGLSDRERELMEHELAIRQDYAERRRQLEEAQQVESTRLSESAYQARIDALRSAENQQVQILLESAQRKQEAEQSWLSGLKRGLGNYADSATNVFAAVEKSVVSAFTGMEDALLNFVTKGKMDFRSLADSIIQDMIRIAIQQSITAPLANLFGGLISSAFGAIGGAASGVSQVGSVGSGAGGMSASAWMPSKWSSGGYTGDGGKFEPAGIVHKGEGVLNQDEIRAIGGETGFQALRRAIRGAGHATGGMAGRPALPPVTSPAGAGSVNVTVNVSSNGATQVEAPSMLQQFGREIGEFVETKVRELQIQSHRQGGIAWRANQGAFA